MNQSAAEEQITKSPTKAEGYLALGKIHRRKDELLAAQSVYMQGLLFAAEKDSQRVELQKEMQEVSATIILRNQTLHLIPNEIWEVVFGYLEHRDLLQCTDALNLWRDIIFKMIGLWNAWENNSSPDKNCYAIRCQSPTIQIGKLKGCDLGHEYEPWVKKFFTMLRCWSNNSFQTLAFADIAITDSMSDFVSEVLQSVHPPFDQVIFRHSTSITTYAFRRILASCVKTKVATFSNTLALSQKSVTTDDVKPSSLTHLELGFSSNRFYGVPITHPTLRDVVCQCPNLVHLTLNFILTAYSGICVDQALKFCPQLKTLEIGRGTGSGLDGWQSAAFGDYCSSADDNSYDETSSALQGLHTLKFSSFGKKTDNFSLIIEKSCKTLQRLYFSCNYYASEHDDFDVLAAHSLSNLQTVHFQLCKKTHHLPPASILHDLTAFFSNAVSLEEIVLDFGYCIHPTDPEPAANELLLTIARKCRLLRRLAVVRGFRYTEDTMFEFASAVGPGLTHMEICMNQQSAPAFVQRLSTLTYFKFSNISHSYLHRTNQIYCDQHTMTCINTIDGILQQRRERQVEDTLS